MLATLLTLAGLQSGGMLTLSNKHCRPLKNEAEVRGMPEATPAAPILAEPLHYTNPQCKMTHGFADYISCVKGTSRAFIILHVAIVAL